MLSELITAGMMHALAQLGTILPTPKTAAGGEGFSAFAMSPLVGLIGLLLTSLLILGGLWVQRRYRTHGLRRAHSTENSTELSAYDSVTSLPTGRLFGTLLNQALSRAARTGRSVALLVVELEHFRMVSKSEGQANGNMLVRVQAARVKSVLRSTDTVARLTQDQFAMIIDHLTSHEEITAIVDKLLATVGLPLTLDGHELFLTCRIGVARYPQDATEREDLIEQAIQAVKTAKAEGQTVRFVSTSVASASPEPVPNG